MPRSGVITMPGRVKNVIKSPTCPLVIPRSLTMVGKAGVTLEVPSTAINVTPHRTWRLWSLYTRRAPSSLSVSVDTNSESIRWYVGEWDHAHKTGSGRATLPNPPHAGRSGVRGFEHGTVHSECETAQDQVDQTGDDHDGRADLQHAVRHLVDPVNDVPERARQGATSKQR